MKTLHSLADLSTYGVGILTGEACSFGLRLLCDLTDPGWDLVAAYLGGPELDCFPPNWNSSVAGQPAVASVMLTRAALSDLCVFALFYRENATVVLERGGTYIGLSPSDEYYDKYEDIVNAPSSGYTVYRKLAHRTDGGRNQHALTGRTT